MQKHDHSSEVSYGVPATLCSDDRHSLLQRKRKSFQNYIPPITLPTAPIIHKVMGWWSEQLKL